jgi:hypothetical protein
MPRINTGANYDNVTAAEAQYVGPTPPAGVYRLRAFRAKIAKNASKDWMWTWFFVIEHEDKSGRAQYNGALVSWTNNRNDKGDRYMKQFIDATGLSGKAIASPMTDDVEGTVSKIGRTAVSEVIVKAGVRRDKYNGEWRLKAASFFEDDGEYAKADQVEDDDEDDELEDEDEYADYDEDEDDADDGDDDAEDEEDDSDDDDVDADEDEEDDEEDDPPARAGRSRRSAAKAAPAKVTPRRSPTRTAAARPARKAAPAKAAGRKRPF